MSNRHSDQEIEESLSKERHNLLEKLSKIFDPDIAQDYVCPKTYDSRHQLSLDELRQQGEAFKQCPPRLVVYTTARKSYQSFVRNQVAQQSPRHELERFVRNSSDIDAAKRYLDTANDALVNPQQSLLLFRSSKLNEQKAHVLKSSGYYNPLQRLTEEPSIQKYFPSRLQNPDDYSIREEDEHPHRDSSAAHSIHLAHDEKKYHVQFLKETSSPSPTLTSSQAQKSFSFRSKDKGKSMQTESIFSTDTSTTTTTADRQSKQREGFPPLSLSALKEYRPTFTPKPVSSPSKLQSRRKSMRKADFIWPQSMLSSTSHE